MQTQAQQIEQAEQPPQAQRQTRRRKALEQQQQFSELAAADAAASAAATNPTARRKRAPRKTKPTCDDCYFMRNMLCSLTEQVPCPTFRDHAQGLKPKQQLAFVFRQERTRAAWVFEPRH